MILSSKIKRIVDRIPPERRSEVIAKIRERMADFEPDNMVDCTIIGGLVGALIDIVPGTGILSEDWCMIGMVCGGLIGRIREKRQRGDREDLLTSVQEVIDEHAG